MLLHQLLNMEWTSRSSSANLRLHHASHLGCHVHSQHPDHHGAQQKTHEISNQSCSHVNGHIRSSNCHISGTMVSIFRVVSIGVNHTFEFIFAPLEYVPTMSKTLNFFGSGFLLCTPMSSIFVSYFSNKKRVHNKLTPPFSLRRAG